MLHFESDLLCKVDVDALQEFIAQEPPGLTATIYRGGPEDCDLGFGKHMHSCGRLVDVYEDLLYFPDMTVGSLVLTFATLAPQEELTHSLAA